MFAADLPPKTIEIQHNAPEPQEAYALHINDCAYALEAALTPQELVDLYLNDYPTFLKQFYEYITSDDMEAQMMEGFDRDQHKKYMKQYFVDFDENVPLKQIPAPLRKGYEDLFRVGAANPQFKKAVQSMLVPTSAIIDKKTGKMKGIYGSDSGSNFTGKIVSLMIELYNTTFVKPVETSSQKPAEQTTNKPIERA